MGGYLPVVLITAAVLATGYTGPVSLEVFNASPNRPGSDIPQSHAVRWINSLQNRINVAANLAPFCKSQLDSQTAISQVNQRLQAKQP